MSTNDRNKSAVAERKSMQQQKLEQERMMKMEQLRVLSSIADSLRGIKGSVSVIAEWHYLDKREEIMALRLEHQKILEAQAKADKKDESTDGGE